MPAVPPAIATDLSRDAVSQALSRQAVRQVRVIHRLSLPDDEAAVLRAMGLGEGQSVQVLRRAPGGDPLHVRLGSGGEFALAAPVAEHILVREQS